MKLQIQNGSNLLVENSEFRNVRIWKIIFGKFKNFRKKVRAYSYFFGKCTIFTNLKPKQTEQSSKFSRLELLIKCFNLM